jgi:hypothetical protein
MENVRVILAKPGRLAWFIRDWPYLEALVPTGVNLLPRVPQKRVKITRFAGQRLAMIREGQRNKAPASEPRVYLAEDDPVS